MQAEFLVGRALGKHPLSKTGKETRQKRYNLRETGCEVVKW
jgi:hypothetical protein